MQMYCIQCVTVSFYDDTNVSSFDNLGKCVDLPLV